MIELHHVKRARKDYPQIGVKKGESYWWWEPPLRGQRLISKEKPARCEYATTSPTLSKIFALEDFEYSIDNLEADVDFILEEINLLISELKALGNDAFRKIRPNAKLAYNRATQERIHLLSKWVYELENIDLDREDKAAVLADIKKCIPSMETRPYGFMKDLIDTSKVKKEDRWWEQWDENGIL